MRTPAFRTTVRFALAAGMTLVAGGAMAQSQPQQVQARVISTAPVTESNGSTSFNVTYEYDGRQYTTRTATPPGATLPIEVNAYGVATMPVAPQPSLGQADDRSRWQNVTPEPGVVVSAGSAPAATYYPAPVYTQPVYTQPVYTQPVYVQPAYAYPYAYAPAYFPPIGLSLNFGYSRGWGGHRGWR